MPNWRLVYGILSVLTASLAVFKAPAYPLWLLALAITEWGHWLAWLFLVPLVWDWRSSKGGRAGAALGLIAFALTWTPWLRAIPVAKTLPIDLSAAFGESRPRPIVDSRLRIETRTYARGLAMDIYRPVTASGPLPGVLVVHGGSWQSGSRRELSALNHYLAQRGYLVASVDYHLAPLARFPAAKEDVLSSLAYLKSHASELGLDKTRLAILGRSAGGQLALLAAYTAGDPSVRGAIAFYAPTDLVYGYFHPSNPLVLNSTRIFETYLGGSPKSVPGLYEAASPVNFVGPRTPPTLLIHGTRDELVFPIHAELLSERLAKAGRPYFVLTLPWATHGCDANLRGPCGRLSTYAVERFLAAVTQ